MEARAGPDGGHRPILFAIFKPRTASSGPDQSAHEGMSMLEEVTHAFRLGTDGLDILPLHLVDDLEDVPRMPFDDRKK